MEREALVVGINKYPRIGDLDMPEADAKAIADILKTYGGFKVTRLPEAPGERVCSERLKTEITRLFCPNGKHPPKTALFFFAGHGLLERLGTVTQSHLATSDSNDATGAFGLSLTLLRALLQDSQVTQQIVWLDCCFSGGFIDPKKAAPDYAKGYDRCFIAACRDYEVAHGVGEHGVLTTALLAGLNPERHPRVTTKTLVAFVTQELRKVALPQSPIHEYSGEEIILTNSGGDGSAKSGWLGIPPYKGLQYFDNNEQDSELFCGRQEMTRQLIDRVRKSNFLVVVGASGSGKSSVVRAGLLHELELGEQLSGSDQWLIIPPFTPGEHPMESLRQAIADSFAKEGEEAIAAADASRVVLVVDQFEEAFTLCQDREERRQFFDCLLGNPVEEYSSALLQIIIVMRSDFFDKLTEPESIRLADKINEDAVSNLFTVTSMRGSELEQAIREPAQKVGLQIGDSLVKQILEDLGVSEPDSVAREPGSLPLLEYTLDLLWQRRQDYDCEDLLTLKGYEDLEGVKGALKKRADEIFKNLANEEKQAAERIFLELTHIGEGAEDTRRRVSKTKLKTKLASAQLPESLIDQVVQKLADEKLVVTSGDSAAESMVEVAHEALIRHWPRLRDWVDTNREAIRTERMIQVAAEEWRDAGKLEQDYLWGGVKLAAAESYCGSVPLSNLAQELSRLAKQSKMAGW
jgi:energy-coupling factor transporter ATP-binding protein EcfA2